MILACETLENQSDIAVGYDKKIVSFKRKAEEVW